MVNILTIAGVMVRPGVFSSVGFFHDLSWRIKNGSSGKTYNYKTKSIRYWASVYKNKLSNSWRRDNMYNTWLYSSCARSMERNNATCGCSNFVSSGLLYSYTNGNSLSQKNENRRYRKNGRDKFSKFTLNFGALFLILCLFDNEQYKCDWRMIYEMCECVAQG